MRLTAKIIYLLLISLCMATISQAQAAEEPVKYLFIQNAKSGLLNYDPKTKTHTLTLYDTDPWIIYFSNAPQRITGFMSEDVFINNLNKDLQQENAGLNAGLIGINPADHKTMRYVIVLSNPQYDIQHHTMTYFIRVLESDKKKETPNKLVMDHVSLFIDRGCASCGGSGF